MKKVIFGFILCCMGIVAFGSDTGDVVSKNIKKWEKRAKRRKRKLEKSQASDLKAQEENATLRSQLAEALAQNELLEKREVLSGKRKRILEERLEKEANKAATYHMIMVGLREENDRLKVQLRSLGVEGESPLDKMIRSFQKKDEQAE